MYREALSKVLLLLTLAWHSRWNTSCEMPPHIVEAPRMRWAIQPPHPLSSCTLREKTTTHCLNTKWNKSVSTKLSGWNSWVRLNSNSHNTELFNVLQKEPWSLSLLSFCSLTEEEIPPRGLTFTWLIKDIMQHLWLENLRLTLLVSIEKFLQDLATFHTFKYARRILFIFHYNN